MPLLFSFHAITSHLIKSTITPNVIRKPGRWANKVLSESRLLMLVCHMFIGGNVGDHISVTTDHYNMERTNNKFFLKVWKMFLAQISGKISGERNEAGKSGDPVNRGPLNWGMTVYIYYWICKSHFHNSHTPCSVSWQHRAHVQ